MIPTLLLNNPLDTPTGRSNRPLGRPVTQSRLSPPVVQGHAQAVPTPGGTAARDTLDALRGAFLELEPSSRRTGRWGWCGSMLIKIGSVN